MKEMLFIISMVTVFTIGSHLYDIGLNAHFENIREGKNNHAVGNGFIDFDAVKTYHIGWYMLYLAFFVLVIAYVMKIRNENEMPEM